MKVEKLQDGRELQEGMKFYLLPDHFDMINDYSKCKTVVLVKNENYPEMATREWLLLDENGHDHSDEWYFYDGAYLEEVK